MNKDASGRASSRCEARSASGAARRAAQQSATVCAMMAADRPSLGAPRRARRRRSRSERVREFEHLHVIVDCDVHHRWLRKWRRGRQAEVPRRHEEDSGLERSVERGTCLRSDHHEQREREHRAQQGKAGLPDCGSEDPVRLAQAGSRRAVQQDRGAIASARTARPLAQPAAARIQGRGPAEVAGRSTAKPRTPETRAATAAPSDSPSSAP